jgi:CCR4-NOT transcription complex subunit 1
MRMSGGFGLPGGMGGPVAGPSATASASAVASQGAPAAPARYGQGFGATLNVDSLIGSGGAPADAETMDEQSQNKLIFLFNNLTRENVAEKASDFRELVLPEHYAYVAHHIVVRRAAVEPNFHPLYMDLLQRHDDAMLFRVMASVTIRVARSLLASEKVTTVASERTLLKNVGSWLGLVTIGRNRMVLAREIDLRQLLLDAYDTGRLIAVVPFVVKVLDACRVSRVIKPPNPWVMGLLSLLLELHNIEDLKLNLKFEVISLLRALSLEASDVVASRVLETRPVDKVSSGDFTTKSADAGSAPGANRPLGGMGMGGAAGSAVAAGAQGGGMLGLNPASAAYVSSTVGGGAGMMPPGVGVGGAGAGAPTGVPMPMMGAGGVMQAPPAAAMGAVMSSEQIRRQVRMPDGPPILQSPAMKAFVGTAVEQAVQEILVPVVDRSCGIASVTTRVLVMKDFALDPSDQRVRQAAISTARSLAGSLAQVTCREPMRMALGNHLRAILGADEVAVHLQQAGVDMDALMQGIVTENLSLACFCVRWASVERAQRDIEAAILPILQRRRQQREQSGVMPVDVTLFAPSQLPSDLPADLRISSNGPSGMQWSLYQGFDQLNQQQLLAGPSPPPAGASVPVGQPPMGGVGVPAVGSMAPGGAYASSAAAPKLDDQSLHQLKTLLDQLVSTVNTLTTTSLSALPPDSPVRIIATQLLSLLRTVDPRSEVASGMSIPQLLSRILLVTGHPLCTQAMLLLLDAIKQQNPVAVTLAVTQQLITLEKAGRLPSMEALILFGRHRLLHPMSMDPFVASKLLEYVQLSQAAADGGAVLSTVASGVLGAGSGAAGGGNGSGAGGLAGAADGGMGGGGGLSAVASAAGGGAGMLSDDASGKDAGSAQQQGALLVAQQRQQQAMRALEQAAVLLDHLLCTDAVMTLSDLPQSVDIFVNSMTSYGSVSVAAVAENVRALLRASSAVPRGYEGNDQYRQTVAQYLTEFVHAISSPNPERATIQAIQAILQQYLLSASETTTQFFRASIDLALDRAESGRVMSLGVALGKLVYVVVRNLQDQTVPMLRSNIMKCFLQATATVLQREHEAHGSRFMALPFQHMLAEVLQLFDMANAQPPLEAIVPQLLNDVVAFMLMVAPDRAPGFAFSWVELLSHRSLLARLMAAPVRSAGPMATQQPRANWALLQRLLMTLLSFMEPFLRTVQMPEPLQLMYKGAMRLLLVLLHDAPDFLCTHYLSLCDVIPPTCVQMRNLVLSAFPVNMRLPDPFMSSLRIEQLPEIQVKPIVNDTALYQSMGTELLAELATFLTTRQPAGFLTDLMRGRLLLSAQEARARGTRYNVPVMNALVLSVCHVLLNPPSHDESGVSAGGPSPMLQGAAMELFMFLAHELDAEGRYHLFSALANNLRFPNAHTHYFSYVMLTLFKESRLEAVREQITRVLLERLIVNRPHPWGLLVTFIELIKNTERYNVWQYSFTRVAPEIERLFEHVAVNCGASRPTTGQ